MRPFSSLLAAALLLTSTAQAKSSTGDRILVALEKGLNQDDYSIFWRSLRERGYDLTFKSPKQDSPSLTAFDERSFDHAIIFAPSTKAFSPDLTPQALVKYLSLPSPGNILIALSSSISEFNRDFAREFSLEFQPSDSYLIDHANYIPLADAHDSTTPHTAVGLPLDESLVKNSAVISAETLAANNPILYRGVAHTVSSTSPLLVPVLHSARTGYSAEPRLAEGQDDSPYPNEFLAGGKAGLVTGFQTLENSRIMFAGSVDLFSDKFTADGFVNNSGVKRASGNAAFIKDITSWTFQESGVIRVLEATHHRQSDSEERDVYRIKDDVTYSLTLQTYRSEGNSSSWVPITLDDLQLDFTMLDPHIRVDLAPVAGSTVGQKYSADFKLPDRHGVFKFLVDYKRPGWSYIHSSQTVSVVPFRHDEYPRFIFGAWPFYSGAASTTAAFLVFAAVWLSLKSEKVAAKQE